MPPSLPLFPVCMSAISYPSKKKSTKKRGGLLCMLWGLNGQECPNGACVYRGLWTITALAKSASLRLNSLSLSSRKGSDVVRMKGGQLLWQRDTKSWTSVILAKTDRHVNEKTVNYVVLNCGVRELNCWSLSLCSGLKWCLYDIGGYYDNP